MSESILKRLKTLRITTIARTEHGVFIVANSDGSYFECFDRAELIQLADEIRQLAGEEADDK